MSGFAELLTLKAVQAASVQAAALWSAPIWEGLRRVLIVGATEPAASVVLGTIAIAAPVWVMWSAQQRRCDRLSEQIRSQGRLRHGHGPGRDETSSGDMVQGYHCDRRHTAQGHEGPWRLINTGQNLIALEIAELDGAPRFRIWFEKGPCWPASDLRVETERKDGVRQHFGFVERDGFAQSESAVPGPHDFTARLQLLHGDHTHDCTVGFYRLEAS